MVLDPIKRAASFMTASKTFLEKRVSIEFITIIVMNSIDTRFSI